MIVTFAVVLLVMLCAGPTPLAMANEQNGFQFSLTRVGNDQIECTVSRHSEVVQTILFGEDFGPNLSYSSTPAGGMTISGNGMSIDLLVTEDTDDFTLLRISRSAPQNATRRDCFRLQSDQMSWFGGPQQKFQYWPVDKLTFDNYDYVTKELDNCAVAERYWLNSRGSFVYLEKQVPLFLDQNLDGNNLCFVAKRQLPYDTHTPGEFTFNYHIGVGKTARDTHMAAIDRFLGKPSGYPVETLVRYPIWSTWTRFYRDIDETVVRGLGQEVIDYGFLRGQIGIDDDWEICYGAREVRLSKFPDMKNLTSWLQSEGFGVTLWIHPFINKVCEPYFSNALTNGFLVKDHAGSTDTQWWNSGWGEAAYVDFTNPEAAQWFVDHMTALRESTGVDGFKFDAGETSWAPPDPNLTGNTTTHPTSITTDFVRAVAQFGGHTEIRSGWLTQDLPILLRMLDKDSDWTWNNGLPTLVTTLLQLNMAGYPLVLPDMIGGNGYDDTMPNKELFLRWQQANVFMPSMQFSFVPWQYDNETIEISRNLIDLHYEYSDLILERFALAVSTGEPVNPPLWWLSPNDRVAQQIDDQFLLGEQIIAAPVLREGQLSRHVYLIAGTWKDGNTGVNHIGPKWLMDYPVPLEMIPYFIRQH